MTKEIIQLPLLPLRGLLVFPSMVLHLDVGRDKSVTAIEKAMMGDQTILLAAQKQISLEDPEPNDIYHIGTIAKVKQMLKRSEERRVGKENKSRKKKYMNTEKKR